MNSLESSENIDYVWWLTVVIGSAYYVTTILHVSMIYFNNQSGLLKVSGIFSIGAIAISAALAYYYRFSSGFGNLKSSLYELLILSKDGIVSPRGFKAELANRLKPDLENLPNFGIL